MTDMTTAPASPRPMRAWVHLTALLLLWAAVFLPALGQDTQVTSREGRHAGIARQMAETGDYVVPYTLDQPYIDKPPLFHVMVAACYRLSGREDLAMARLPSALCVLAALVGVYVLGRRWLTPRAGFLAAAIWTTSWLVVEWGRMVQMDAMLSCLVLYGLLLADSALTAPTRWRGLLWTATGLMLGAATLSKGAMALFYFLVPLLPVVRARRGRWLPPVPWLLLVVGLAGAMVAGWILLAEARHPGHLALLMGYQFGEGVSEHPSRLFLYLDQLFLRTAPWGIFAIGAAVWVWRRIDRRRYDGIVIPGVAVAVGLAVMTMLPNKREHYLLPLLPMWSLFLAAFIDDALSSVERRDGSAAEARELKWLFEWPLRIVSAATLAGLVGLAVCWPFQTRAYPLVGGLYWAGAAAVALFGVVASWRRRALPAVAALLLAFALLDAGLYTFINSGLLPPRADVVPGAQLAASVPTDAPAAGYRVDDEYFYFRLARRAVCLKRRYELREFLSQPGARYVIVDGKDRETVLRMAARPVQVVASAEMKRGQRLVLRVEGIPEKTFDGQREMR